MYKLLASSQCNMLAFSESKILTNFTSWLSKVQFANGAYDILWQYLNQWALITNTHFQVCVVTYIFRFIICISENTAVNNYTLPLLQSSIVAS